MFKEPGNELATHVCILPYMQEAVKQTRTTIYPHFVLLLCLVCNLYILTPCSSNQISRHQLTKTWHTPVILPLSFCYLTANFLEHVLVSCDKRGRRQLTRATPNLWQWTSEHSTSGLGTAFVGWLCQLNACSSIWSLKSLGVYLCTHWWRAQRKKKNSWPLQH